MKTTSIEQLSINTIRTLAMDAVQAANSGHPGTPMALAPLAYCLWQEYLKFDPEDPIWPNRDRFILSAGHASMLLYSLLHLTRVKAVNAKYEILGSDSVSLEDIKSFRQLNSKCPGHPEYRWTSGIETTTGPLGQGVANSVGMALAAQWMAQYFNRPHFPMIDYRVYTICGDGDMMEGISSEAASLAGHLGLSNLVWLYDNNRITIEGNTNLAFSEDVEGRFRAYQWNVYRVFDANDLSLIRRALSSCVEKADKPTLIIIDSHIAWGSPNKQDLKSAHGEPLGEEEIRLTKKNYDWPQDEQFLIPPQVYQHFADGIGKKGQKARLAWLKLFKEYEQAFPQLAQELYHMQHRTLPQGWDEELPYFAADKKGLATRDSSGKVLNAIATKIPWMIGGAADLSPSTKTHIEGEKSIAKSFFGGKNIHFGIREHAMGAILNGLALSKMRAFGSTFLIFSDYLRPTLRLSALMELPVIYIFTHDSIGVGEDGPTHQPIEQLPSLRAIPGLITIRPCDANEVVEAWRFLIPLKHQPVVLVLSRQALPTLDRTKYASAQGLHHGAYVLIENSKEVELILIASGSEVSLCLEAYELLHKHVGCRVVSMPSWEIFEKQDSSYRETILPSHVKARIAIEQASTFGWERYIGSEGICLGMKSFGVSAPLKALLHKFGFTPEHIEEISLQLVKKYKS